MITPQLAAQIDSPSLVIFPERVRHNIRLAVEMAGSPARLRPHVKTHKSPDATQLMMAAGITKFKCATIAEAEMLAQNNAPDVLLAYQPLGPKLARFIELTIKYPATTFSCLTDHPDAAREQSAAFVKAGIDVPVYVDLNLGMNRTGIAPGEPAFSLYHLCNELPGLQPIGFQAYDGHLRQADFDERTKAADTAFAAVEDLRRRVTEAELAEPLIIAGGSPTFPIHARRPDVECSPGTFVYWDKGYSDLCPEQYFQPAAWLMTRVISLPDAEHICLDLGHKSVAAENPIDKRVYFPYAPELRPTGQSEEHLVMHAGKNHSWKPGDVLWGIPYHVCPTIALYERAITIENEAITGEWKAVARDRKLQC